MSFKQFFKEAKEVNYEHPPERAKFQLGDLIVVRDNGRWRTYQSKKTEPYINQIGEVVGYKNVPGAYTKFALKFSDGNVFLIHSHFLFGPFKDLKTAEKYTDPKVTIIPTDIKITQKANSLTEYQKRDKLESTLRDFLPKIGYSLLEPPVEVVSEDGQYVYTVLATMDIENSETKVYSVNNIIPGKYVCYRENKIKTKKLKSAMDTGFNAIIGDRDFSNGFGYFIQAPARNTNDEIDTNTIYILRKYGLHNNPDMLKQDKIIKYFADYRSMLEQIKEGKYNTDLDLINLFYKVEGDTITGDVKYDSVKLHDPYFYASYKIIGDFTCYDFEGKLKDLTVAPKEVTGEFYFHGKNLKSLRGLPKAGSYNLNTTKLNDKPITDIDIETALMKHTLKPETAQTFSDIIDEL